MAGLGVCVCVCVCVCVVCVCVCVCVCVLCVCLCMHVYARVRVYVRICAISSFIILFALCRESDWLFVADAGLQQLATSAGVCTCCAIPHHVIVM